MSPSKPTSTDPAARRAVPVVLVDGHNLLWGATFGFPAQIRSRDKTRDITGVFAFFALLGKTLRDHVTADAELGPAEVLVVFDGEHGSAERATLDPAYKANRAVTDPANDAARAPLLALPDVKRGLDLYDITWCEHDASEADDVIATIATEAADAGRDVLIYSRDRDFYQLLSDRVAILNTTTRPPILRPAHIHTRYRVTPAQWASFRALTGDPADNIPGVPGIGAKTAAGLLADGLTLADLPTSGRLQTGRHRLVHTHWERAQHALSLIAMHTDLPVTVPLTGHPSPTLPRPADVIDKLGLW